MNDEMVQFLMILDGFRKTNIFRMIPDIAPNDYAVLKVIEKCGQEEADMEGVKVSRLVRMLRRQASMVSRSLRSLEQKGLVRRAADPKDRRNTFVSLTEAGYDKISSADQILKDFAEGVFLRMGKDKIQQLYTVLLDFQKTINEEIKKRSLKTEGGHSENMQKAV